MNWFGEQFGEFFARWFGTEETPVPPTPVPSGGGRGYPRGYPRPMFDAGRRLREEDEIVMATIAAFMNVKANS